jgi:hypothetical protein
MPQITHDNHFVPQLYLKQWSKDRSRIWSYRTLVSHATVKKWELKPISGVAFHRDLYTTISNGEEIDDFEKWIESDFENPVKESLNKVIKDMPLIQSDWIKLARFLAAQDVRTPVSYLETIKRLQDTLPNIMQDTLEKSVKEMEKKVKEGNPLKPNPRAESLPSPFKRSLKVNVKPNPKSEGGGGVIEATITLGRLAWLENQQFILQKTAKALLNHKWSILKPANGLEWFTTDHPVVRLNYYKEGSYDLKGGWGKHNGNLFMPLSPNHLLFTQIGTELPDRIILSKEETSKFQKFIAERAFRWIFAKNQTPIIEHYRPRNVDLEKYKDEEALLKTWHEEQSFAEKDL